MPKGSILISLLEERYSAFGHDGWRSITFRSGFLFWSKFRTLLLNGMETFWCLKSYVYNLSPALFLTYFSERAIGLGLVTYFSLYLFFLIWWTCVSSWNLNIFVHRWFGHIFFDKSYRCCKESRQMNWWIFWYDYEA